MLENKLKKFYSVAILQVLNSEPSLMFVAYLMQHYITGSGMLNINKLGFLMGA